MNNEEMKQSGVATLVGRHADLEIATDIADEKMCDFLQDSFGSDRIVVGVSTQVLFVNDEFRYCITVLFRY